MVYDELPIEGWITRKYARCVAYWTIDGFKEEYVPTTRYATEECPNCFTPTGRVEKNGKLKGWSPRMKRCGECYYVHWTTSHDAA
ncbi:MAG: hypothetical protein RMK94_17330 [Armatimonadota bacterium]|nr:hypothetical protein [Armatimonadota bacterium]